MNGIRPVHPTEVKLKIDNEARLIAFMANELYAANDLSINMRESVLRAYEILDITLQVQEERLQKKLEAETRRRRGF